MGHGISPRVVRWRGARIEEYGGPAWRFGRWTCEPGATAFREPNVSGPDAMLVFPTVPVAVRHGARPEVVANRHFVVLRNPSEVFGLRALGGRGDACAWVAVSRHQLSDLATVRPELAQEQPFATERVLVDASLFLAQRRLFGMLRRDHDVLGVAEAVAALAARCLVRRTPTSPRGREIARAAEILLSVRYTERLSLANIAAVVGCSPWHLARVFRAEVGTTLHQYRDQLRLRAAVDYLGAPVVDLASLALELGYVSHSHFTDRFRAAFGSPPSAHR